MTKNYQVSVNTYSLNELTKTLANFIYGDKVVNVPTDWAVPAFSNLVHSGPNTKGITWEFEYKSQADNLASKLTNILNRIEN